MNNLHKKYRSLPLAERIRISYFVILVPFIVLLIVCIWNIWETNSRYDEMIESAVAASAFSQDFKSDYDEEVYFIIIGNKTPEESNVEDLLKQANEVVGTLKSLTHSEDNGKRLKSADNSLKKLEKYTDDIAANVNQGGDTYEENYITWNNDIKIITGLVQETMSEYIYYEIKDFQIAREEYKHFYHKLEMAMIISMIVLGIIVLIFSYVIPASISNPIKRISKVTDQVSKGDLTVRSDVKYGGEVGVLSESLNAMIDKINQLLDQVTEEQVRLRKAELELLQSQINPHFLYNTLDTIVWLAEAGNQKQVVSMVKSLSDFFRTSLNQGKDIISVKDELLHVKSYLAIQYVRYQDILEYEVDVPEELWDYQIPKITLQPLVENALYHGIKNKREGGKITVTGETRDGVGVLIVEDNGHGIEKERLQQVREKLNGQPGADDIYGISNVNERIKLKFGDQYGITISSIYDQGTRVEIYLPI